MSAELRLRIIRSVVLEVWIYVFDTCFRMSKVNIVKSKLKIIDFSMATPYDLSVVKNIDKLVCVTLIYFIMEIWVFDWVIRWS